jgi:hypothetical protein
VKDISPAFRFVFGQMTRALMASDDSALGKTFRDLGFRMQQDADGGYEALGKAYVGDISREILASDAGYADPALFRESYRQMMKVLRSNPLLKVPPDLLFVGRVMGLLNGLSMTLGSKTNLLVQMARMLDEDAAARANGTEAQETKTRRLLEA